MPQCEYAHNAANPITANPTIEFVVEQFIVQFVKQPVIEQPVIEQFIVQFVEQPVVVQFQ